LAVSELGDVNGRYFTTSRYGAIVNPFTIANAKLVEDFLRGSWNGDHVFVRVAALQLHLLGLPLSGICGDIDWLLGGAVEFDDKIYGISRCRRRLNRDHDV
jgi:hypothetical protein